MNNKNIKNVAQSVRERLKIIAHRQNREHQDLTLSYLIERFLYRLSKAGYGEEFYLKGALMLQVLGEKCTRATRDIDFMSQSHLSPEKTREIIKEVMTFPVSDDGVTFDSETLKVTDIQRDARQRGVRASFVGNIGTARATLQLDIGPYYKIIPSPIAFDFPELLSYGSPSLLGYSPESIIADKFEAMISRDDTNTRLKDFYDIWILSTARRFDYLSLREAITETFAFYKTPIPIDIPFCFNDAFRGDAAKINQWRAFLRNAELEISLDFYQINRSVELFLMPVCEAINQKSPKNLYWVPNRSWSEVLG